MKTGSQIQSRVSEYAKKDISQMLQNRVKMIMR